MASLARLFIAIDLPKPLCRRLAGLIGPPPRGVRPVPAAQMHLTLHFLGDVDDGGRAALGDSLGRVREPPFPLAVRGTGVFPRQGRPSVLWAGVAESAGLVALHAAVARQIESCGLAVEQRPYVPHVTLARLAPSVERGWVRRFLAETAGLEFDGFVVQCFRLYRSRKLDGASEHVAEADFPLEVAG